MIMKKLQVIFVIRDFAHDCSIGGGENLLRSHTAAPRESRTFWPLWWRISLSIRVQTTLTCRWFFSYRISRAVRLYDIAFLSPSKNGHQYYGLWISLRASICMMLKFAVILHKTQSIFLMRTQCHHIHTDKRIPSDLWQILLLQNLIDFFLQANVYNCKKYCCKLPTEFL